MHISNYVELNRLEGAHYAILASALRNVLGTEIALLTFAQIVDGLPTSDVAWDQYGSKHHPNHPVNSHKTLCDGALEKAKEFRANFTLGEVKVDIEKVEQYQNADTSSRSFTLRLIEMTACVLHQIGVLLSQMEKLHDPSTTNGYDIDCTTKWERPPDQWARVVPWPTMFIKTNFVAHEQYPNGIDDIVGYWAENRILGGVSLFNHSQSWGADDEPNVYFSCTRANVTFRVCQLLDDQQSALLAFLLADTGDAPALCPLPVLPGSQNRHRIDPVDAIPIHKVYRDEWERKPPQLRLRMQRFMRSCTKSSLDYLEVDVDEDIERLNRM
ncbi:hypothetical protein ACHAP5_003830 [Fusarium lateritium]